MGGMEDSSHLEKMGRELKCPICLSLLNSAVSLTCNHVFCNACISRSMKSVSYCPVCKVPFHRREVRPAPHMDNLVAVYKSMELDSGINIFVTQTAPLTKEPGEKVHGESDGISSNGEVDRTSQRRSKKQKLFKCKRSNAEKTDMEISGSHPSAQPSFPAKKRVQVPLCHPAETPQRPEKVLKLGDKSTENELERQSGKLEENGYVKDRSISSKRPDFDDKGDPVFSPFFWLRERDDNDDDSELGTQLTASDHLTATSPRNVPSFSDIKDSDDENPKLTASGELQSKSKGADDSELFEWTQRACSPELCSTPVKKQTVDKQAVSGGRDFEAVLQVETAVSQNMKRLNSKQGGEKVALEHSIELHKKTEIGNAKSRRKSVKIGRKTKVQEKCAGKLIAAAGNVIEECLGEVPVEATKFAGKMSEVDKSVEDFTALNPVRRTSKRITKNNRDSQTKRVKISENQIGTMGLNELLEGTPIKQINTTGVNELDEEAPIKLKQGKHQDPGNENIGIQLPSWTCLQNENDRSQNVEINASKRCKKIYTQDHRKGMKIVYTGQSKLLREIPVNGNKRNENMNSEFPVLSCQPTEHDRSATEGGKSSQEGKEITKRLRTNRIRQSKGRRRSKKLDNYVASEEVSERILSRDSNKENQTISELNKNNEGITVEYPRRIGVTQASKVPFLRKCKSVPCETPCVFCHSSDISEDSGELVCYFGGKPVAADYNGGSNLIRSHKNCTEWAPNVYFENDSAINLEAEITRSKRIACVCCGIKGAALGCYEKSCRKSFHFPCAKLVPSCRWDTENFVMLCPLHAKCKLPKDVSESQKQSRKGSVPKVQIETQAIGQFSPETTRAWKWPLGSPIKWVICCSALTDAEKEIVSEFTRLTGVSMSKTWSSAVTHVIASTDGNGACRRTLKFFMGILEGTWILKIDWIKACMLAMEPVDEEQYEIGVDIHGVTDGPRLGRLRGMNKEPKLFNGLKFYFTGEFMPSFKANLQELVVAGGGLVLHRKPISRDRQQLLDESSSNTIIIYSLELPEKCDNTKKPHIVDQRRNEAETLANAIGAKAAAHTYILDSIAACRLQNFI